MTLYIKPQSFQGSRQLSQLANLGNASNNNNKNMRYFLQISIQGQRARLYHLQKSKLRYIQLSSSQSQHQQQNKKQQQWIILAINDYRIQIKLLVQQQQQQDQAIISSIKQPYYQTLAVLQLTKQQLITDNGIINTSQSSGSTLFKSNQNVSVNNTVNNNLIRCHYMLQKHKINFQIKFNPYKRVIKSLRNNIGFISALSVLQKQQQQKQLYPSLPSKLQRVQYHYQQKQSNTKQPITIISEKQQRQQQRQRQRDSSPLEPANPQQLYIGPCQNKNIFSILDPTVKDQKYKIFQPSYQ